VTEEVRREPFNAFPEGQGLLSLGAAQYFALRCVSGFTGGASPPNPLPEMVKEPPRAAGCVIAKSPPYVLPYGDYFSPFREARFLPALNGGISARRFR
jgi:hypothetical protein